MSDDTTLKMPIVNDPHAPELYSDDVTGVQFLGGTYRITLESWRWDYSEPDQKIDRVVNARLVLTPYAAMRLASLILQHAQAAAQTAPAADTADDAQPLVGEQTPPQEPTIN